MSDSDDVPDLPVEELQVRGAIAEQIRKFGLDKLTNRVIRQNLKEEFGVDFSDYKPIIDKITMEIAQQKTNQSVTSSKTVNQKVEQKQSQPTSSDSDSDGGVVFTDAAPKKKPKNVRKRTESGSDSSLLEVSQKRRRAAPTPKKGNQAKKKTAKEGGPKRKTAYSVYCALTEDLASVVGKPYMRRSDVVKAMWAYFRANNLLDPKDRRYVVADDPLFKIFKKKRFLAFGIMGSLGRHIIEGKFLNDEDRAALEKYAIEEDARRAATEEEKADDSGENGEIKGE
ncbi:hypothetical protein AB6A40_004532 [Gnathostoma spinigerum]|uniref:DM2 domain-containing protein n=1 Tax=Gnathostoma spinigerum TaxID=75299 RepID=A0ABD6ECX8_9BILA